MGMDANSGPEFPAERSVWKLLKSSGLSRSVWDAWHDAEGAPRGGVPGPVSTNKLRGPLTAQTAKMGQHALDLIDHVWFSEELELGAHVSPPVRFGSEAEALGELIP